MSELDNFFEHHGVKGMKWGVRRKRKGSGSSDKGASLRGTKKKEKEDISKLSNEELQKRVSRMNLERQYSALQKERRDASKSSARKAADEVAGIVKNAAKQQVSNQINSAMGSAISYGARRVTGT